MKESYFVLSLPKTDCGVCIMDFKYEGVAWVADIRQKFETLCLDVDDVMHEHEETFKYVENQLQTVGANIENQLQTMGTNIKQFCSEFVQDVLPAFSSDPTEGVTPESTPQQNKNTDPTALESSKVGVESVDINPKKGLCNCNKYSSVHLLFVEPMEGVHIDSLSKQHSDTGLTSGNASLAISDERSDDVGAEKSWDAHVIQPGMETAQFGESKLDDSFVVVNSNKLSSVCFAMEKRQSCKNKFRKVFTSKMKSAKEQECGQLATGYEDLDTGLNQALVPARKLETADPDGFYDEALHLHLHLHHQFSIPSLSSQFSLFPSSSSSSKSLSMASTRPSLHSSDSNPNPTQPSLLVFSGGTAFNGVVEELKKLTTRVAHILPVSDDGGSTAEIVRVLGGPAVGDIRSRCLRLSDQSTFEALAVRRLLGHRLPLDAQEAKSECGMILWKDSILFGTVSQNPTGKLSELFWFIFRIRSSVGRMNHFVSAMGDIPTESLVLPVISTNDRLTLGCELWDGTIIRGQNEISHPTNGSMEPINKVSSSTPALPSRIKRVFYMSSEGNNLLHEVFPNVNPTVLDQLRTIDCIIYAMGSLFTSICPSLVLLGIGEIIASRSCPKVLLLNGTHDRETSGFSAACFVTAIADALNRTYGDPHNCLKNLPSQYINTLLVPKDGQIPVVAESLATQGIFRVITVDSVRDPNVGVVFEPKSLIQALGDLLSGYTSTNAIRV
ncbi:unnamed protein product [Camellia sinensis]